MLNLRRSIASVLILVLVSLLNSWAVAAPEKTTETAADKTNQIPKLDFQAALKRALERSPDFDVAKRNALNARLNYKNSWAVLLPQVDIQLQHLYNSQGGSAYSTTTTTSTGAIVPLTATQSSDLFGLTVNENLYDNGDSWRAMEVAEYGRDIGNLTLKKGQQQLLLNVAKAFYNYSSAVANLELQEQEIETLRQEFRTIEGRYQQGVNSNRDFLRIKAQLQKSEIDFATQKISLQDSLQSLRLAMGERETLEFVALRPEPEKLKVLQFPNVQPEDSFDYQIAHLQNLISDLKYRTVQRQDWPRLSLKSEYSYNDPQYLNQQLAGTEAYWNFQVALVLDYSLWDWGTRSNNVEIADNQRSIDNDGQESTRIQVKQDLNRLSVQVGFLSQSFKESEQILKDEQAVYTSLNLGYREGKTTYLELITALSDLYSAKSQFLNLQYSLLSARASLGFYQGNLDEVLFAP
jgi:outer membrane protein TolC